MNPIEDCLDRVCDSEETKEEARRIMRLAHAKIGPGKGRDLGSHTVGLPAACALIASRKLNNGDVLEKSAQAASCLKESDFNKVLNLLNDVLAENDQKTKRQITAYKLYKRYEPDMPYDTLNNFCEQVRDSLTMLNGGTRLDSAEVCGVFHWVCSFWKIDGLPKAREFADENSVSSKQMSATIKQLNTKCVGLGKRIADAKLNHLSPKKATTTPSPTKRSPTKRPLRVLPSKDSPKKLEAQLVQPSELEAEAITADAEMPPLGSPIKPKTPMKTPAQRSPPPRIVPSKDTPKIPAEPEPESEIDDANTMPPPETPSKKRKLDTPTKSILRTYSSKRSHPVAASSSSRRVTLVPLPKDDDTDVEMAPPETPTKKQRTELSSAALRDSPFKALKRTDLPSHSPTTSPRRGKEPERRPSRLSSAVEPDVEPESESEEEEEEDQPRRRFRPVYLEYQQWQSRDPRLKRIWKHAAAQKQKMTELYGYPFERYRPQNQEPNFVS